MHDEDILSFSRFGGKFQVPEVSRIQIPSPAFFWKHLNEKYAFITSRQFVEAWIDSEEVVKVSLVRWPIKCLTKFKSIE